ncbi:MAG: hypothetical protein ABEK03_00285 [Candidatus Bipolaricaulia bacterium]
MRTDDPRLYMIVGGLLLVVGVVVPFLMVIQMLESTFVLNFLSFAASVAGLALGLLGAFSYIRLRR